MFEPYWNRAWQIAIDTQGSSGQNGKRYILNSAVSSSEAPLRVQFAVDTAMMLSFWTADVVIYNLRQAASYVGTSLAEALTADMLFLAGDTVTISAGYQPPNGPFVAEQSMLFSGRVFQPVLTRVGVVDWTMKLRCVNGLVENMLNFVNFPLTGAPTYYDTLNRLAQEAGMAPNGNGGYINIDDTATTLLQSQSLGRGQVFFSRPYEAFNEIVQKFSMFAWLTPAPVAVQGGTAPVNSEYAVNPQPKPTLHVRSFRASSLPDEPEVSYGPPNLDPTFTRGIANFKPTVIGVPEQTQNGVVFRVLMDSSLHIGMAIQLVQGTVIAPFQFTFQGSYPPASARNGMFIVYGVRHVGDTRGQGDDWYSEVTAVNYDWFTGFVGSMTAGAAPSTESTLG